MNARKFLNVRVISLTATALGLCGLLAMSATTTSCASSNGGSGGAAGGGGGEGGSGGGGTTGGNCSDPGSNAVNFCDGKAQGAMTGYAFIALGLQDTATDPVCAEDPNDLTVTRLITAPPTGECDAVGKTCPTTGHTVWKPMDDGSLCITGKIPAVQGSDYTSDWGLQIGVNTSDPPADSSGNGQTLGQVSSDAANYTSITLNTNGSVTPANTAIRTIIHLVSQSCTENPYCATMQSGKANLLTSFNTECWNGSSCGTSSTCKQLQASDIPNIDKIAIQISSDTSHDYTVDNFCLQSITFQ